MFCGYQRLKDPSKDTEPVEDHLPASIYQGASNIHLDENMEDKSKLLELGIDKRIRTYMEVFGELPLPASCDKLLLALCTTTLVMSKMTFLISILELMPRSNGRARSSTTPVLMHTP